jgi:hypothetical protein
MSLGQRPRPYEAKYAAGTRVRIQSLDDLERFKREWKYHNKLTDDQLTYAGAIAVVGEVYFYHGGDPLYVLLGLRGLWHEECLLLE